MKTSLRNIYFASSVLCLGLVTSGTRGCQEDYDLASYSNTTPTPTPTTTPTPTPTPTPSPSTSPTTAAGLTNLNDLFRDALIQNAKIEDSQPMARMRSPISGLNQDADLNWASQWKEQVRNSNDAAELVDTDQDGFLDWYEINNKSDPDDSKSSPAIKLGSLTKKLLGTDNDADGLPNRLEERLGTDIDNADSDEDGTKDGAEVISGANPTVYGFFGPDSDGDGLSDAYETNEGLNPQSFDTDGDGLRDDDEIALAANPFSIDTDSDGITDGRELMLGGHPSITD